MTPADLLALVSGPDCQRQSRQRFLESVTAEPGNPRPHFPTARLATPWLLAGSQASVPTVYVCRGVLLPGGSHHPIPCLAELPLALGQLFLKPWPAQQTPKASSATLVPHPCFQFSFHITSLHTHVCHPTGCEARTDTRLHAVYYRPYRTRCSFL